MFFPEIIITILSFITDIKTLKNAVSYFITEGHSVKLTQTVVNPTELPPCCNETDYRTYLLHVECSGMKTPPFNASRT